MTHDISRSEKSRQSEPPTHGKKVSGVLLAAVSALSVSLGVTAAQAAGEIKTDGGSAPEFSTKVAETQTTNQTNVKTTNPNKPKVSNQLKQKGGPAPDPAVQLNPQPLPPSESGQHK
jgi:hypothetical protein